MNFSFPSSKMCQKSQSMIQSTSIMTKIELQAYVHCSPHFKILQNCKNSSACIEIVSDMHINSSKYLMFSCLLNDFDSLHARNR